MSSRSRLIIVAMVGLCLLGTGVAHAATEFFNGSVKGVPDAVVGFEVRGPKERGGFIPDKARIEDFLISGVTVTRTCADGESSTTQGAFLFEEDIDVQADADFRGEEQPVILGPTSSGR